MGDVISEQLVGDLQYEFGTFVSQAALYLDRGRTLSEHELYGPAADGLLEAILNRLRALNAFFTNAKKQETDVVASAVATGWQVCQVLTDNERTAINKRLSHITSERLPDHTWPIGDMVHRALEASATFLEQPELAPLASVRDEIRNLLANWGERSAVVTAPNRHAYWP